MFSYRQTNWIAEQYIGLKMRRKKNIMLICVWINFSIVFEGFVHFLKMDKGSCWLQQECDERNQCQQLRRMWHEKGILMGIVDKIGCQENLFIRSRAGRSSSKKTHNGLQQITQCPQGKCLKCVCVFYNEYCKLAHC